MYPIHYIIYLLWNVNYPPKAKHIFLLSGVWLKAPLSKSAFKKTEGQVSIMKYY